MPLPKLGILAGFGPLPRRLVEACREDGRPFFVVAFDGETDPALVADAPHLWAGLGAVGKILAALKREGCREVTLCGPVRRPNFSRLKLDWQGIKLMGRIAGLAGAGDDALLRAVIGALEGHGFRVVGAETILGKLLAPAGPLGALEPDSEARRDIAVGVAAARALGARDAGQAVVVRAGAVVAEEDSAGTDALLVRVAGEPRASPSGVLVKMKKPQQDRRADLPTIGLETVRRAAEAGLAGIAVEAGQSFVLERSRLVAEADARGLFVVGVAAENGEKARGEGR